MTDTHDWLIQYNMVTEPAGAMDSWTRMLEILNQNKKATTNIPLLKVW